VRVSADTKTCGSELNICHLYGGLYYSIFWGENQLKSAILIKNVEIKKARHCGGEVIKLL
jgi:hypothetical protein